MASSRGTGSSCRSPARPASPRPGCPVPPPVPRPESTPAPWPTIDPSCSSPRSASRRPQPTRDDGQDHVVHRGLEHPADQLHVVERDREPGKAPPIRHRSVERRARRGEEPGRWLLAPARQLAIVHPEVGHRLHPGLQRAQASPGCRHERGRRVPQHLGVGGQRSRAPFRRQRHHPGLGFRSMNAASTEAPLTPSRMAWCTLATSAVRLPLEPLDHVHLPEGAVGSSWRLMTPATKASSSALPPGEGRLARLRWSSSSNSGSSTHTGWCRPKGTRSARWRNGGRGGAAAE